MDELVRNLPVSARILDLGAGGGSFAYTSTLAQVVAVDLAFPSPRQPCLGSVIGAAERLPLEDHSMDVVICNHTLEHLTELEGALREINRVLKMGGHLWAAVPNGFSYDDRLYRLVFRGGGHINQFSLQSFVDTLERGTELQALYYKTLHSGLVFLNPPSPEKLPHYPRCARVLGSIPPAMLLSFLRYTNHLVRFVDRHLHSQLSHYGWAVVLRREEAGREANRTDTTHLKSMQEELNVCFSCGTGHPESVLVKVLRPYGFWKTYQCPSCGTTNLFTRSET
jgi:SAM-dependent methyltransferase